MQGPVRPGPTSRSHPCPHHSAPSLQSAPSAGQADGPRDLVPVVGVSDGEAHSVLFDLHEGGQGLSDVLGGHVQRGAQALGRHGLHLGGQLGLTLRQEGLGGPTAQTRWHRTGSWGNSSGETRRRPEAEEVMEGPRQTRPRHVSRGFWRSQTNRKCLCCPSLDFANRTAG